MAARQLAELNQNNRLYLYGLLRAKLGCGKQAFVTQVEDALASEELDARSLGYDGTRELLEDLSEFVTLTVFKGGRLYATIEARPEWDEALDAAGGASSGGGSAKPWKRKRGQRPLKPVRPRTVSVEEPVAAVEAVVEATIEAEATPATGAETETAPAVDPGSEAEATPAVEDDVEVAAGAQAAPEADVENEAESLANEAASLEENPSIERDSDAPASSDGEEASNAGIDGAEDSAPFEAADSATVPPAAPIEPAFTFTVTFDPDNEDAGVTTLESTPITEAAAPILVNDAVEEAEMPETAGVGSPAPSATKAGTPERAGSEPAASAKPASYEAAHPAAARPVDPYPGLDLSVYPVDFSTDVWCPATLLYQLADLLPLGADALGIAGAWFGIACARGTAALGRNRATFPLPYLRDGKRCEATVTLKRRASGDAGASWAIDQVEAE